MSAMAKAMGKAMGKAKAKAKAKAAPLPPRPVVQVAPMSRRGLRAAHEAHSAAKAEVKSATLVARTRAVIAKCIAEGEHEGLDQDVCLNWRAAAAGGGEYVLTMDWSIGRRFLGPTGKDTYLVTITNAVIAG